MTQLLISVRDVEEARIVLQHPIGILDVKEPDRGALGGADAETLQEIGALQTNAQSLNIDKENQRSLHESANLAEFSFSAGELIDWFGNDNESLVNTMRLVYPRSTLARFRFVKIGLARMASIQDWDIHWTSLFEGLPASASPVAVAYFDYQTCDSISPDCVIDFASEHGRCRTVLLDTYNKSGNLFSHCRPTDLLKIVDKCKWAGLTVVVAGSIDQECLRDVMAAAPDFIGVRGAVCRGKRTGRVDSKRVAEFLNAVNRGGLNSEAI